MNGIVHTEGWKMWESPSPSLVSTVKVRVWTRRKKRILTKAASRPLNLELSQHRNKTAWVNLNSSCPWTDGRVADSKLSLQKLKLIMKFGLKLKVSFHASQ